MDHKDSEGHRGPRGNEEMTKGTTSQGRRHTKSHTLCPRCGEVAYHIQKSRCASCGFPSRKMRSYGYQYKALRRRTTGTGRCAHLRQVQARFRAGTLSKL